MAALSVLLLATLQTARGKALLASALSRALSSQPDGVVEIGRIDGIVPGDMHIDKISISDHEGPWLVSENISLRWSLRTLLTGKIHIEELVLGTLDLKRRPARPESVHPAEWKIPSWPKDILFATVDRLLIRDLLLGESILGQKTAFELCAAISESPGQLGRTAALNINRTDWGPETSVNVEIMFGDSPNSLSVRAEVRDESSLTGAALGLPSGPVHLTLEGSGPLSEWNATFQGSAAAYGTVAAGITLQADEQTAVSINGKIAPYKSTSTPAWLSLPDEASSFGLTALIDPRRQIQLSRAWISGRDYQSELSGSYELHTKEIRADWRVTITDLGTLAQFAGTPFEGDLTAGGTLSGTLRAPRGTASFLLRKVHINSFRAAQIQSEMQLTSLPRSTADRIGLRLSGTIRARELSAFDNAPIAENFLTWSLELEKRHTPYQIVTTFLMEEGPNKIELGGRMDTERRSGNFDVALQVNDSMAISAIIGKPLPRKLSFELHLAGSQKDRYGSANFKGKLEGMERLTSWAKNILGPETVFQGNLDLREGLLKLQEFRLSSPAMNISGKADSILSNRAIKGEWEITFPALDRFPAPSGISMAGSLKAAGFFAGPFSALEHSATVTLNRFAIQGKRVSTARIDIRARDVPASPQGSIHIDLKANGDSLSASTDFKIQENQFTLSSLGIFAPGTKVSGEITLDPQKRLANGNLKGRVENLAAIGRIIGAQLAGNGKFDVFLSTGKTGQDIKASLDANAIMTPVGDIRKLELSADIKNALDKPDGNARLRVQGLHRGDLIVDSTFDISGGKNGLAFFSSARGQSRQEFELNTRGIITFAKEYAQIRLGTFEGRMGGHRFNLTAPATVQRKGESLSLESLSLAFDPGRISASGKLVSGHITFDTQFEKIPVDRSTGVNVPGIFASATGKVRVEGALSHPSLSLKASIIDTHAKKHATGGATALHIQADIEAGNLKATGRLQSAAQGPVTARMSLPVRFSLSPFALFVPPEGRIQGDLEGQVELALLASLVPRPDHEFTGRAEAKFSIQGTPANPDIGGNVTVKNGTYQNLSQGTVLKDLDIEIAVRGRKLEIVRATATDGEKGSLTARGSVSLQSGGNFPVELDATLSKIAIIRRPDATGSVDGSLKLSGSIGKMTVTGKLQFGPAEISIQHSRPQSIARLDVVEIHGAKGTSPVTRDKVSNNAEKSLPMLSPDLDISINIPGNIFVRGRGLDSEWKGDLRVKGLADAPAVTGNLKTIRGTFDFLGKRFSVSNGALHFYGSVPPAPAIDVTAESRAREITARLQLRGPVSAPEIKLDSDPPMPPDEILARILFNRAAGNITPMQALRLADGLRVFSGRGHTLDFLGRTREFLGLGQLELRETGKKDALGLGIGKYLTEDIYVDVEKGVAQDTAKGTVRIEITPNLTVQTEAGLEGSQGIGVQWKHDY